MKIQVAPDGTVTLDTGSVSEALEFVAAMRSVREPGLGELTAELMQVWELLGDDITSAPVIAEALGISRGAASQRLLRIHRLGLASRVGHGMYRRAE